MSDKFDLVVIGGGPGGYVAAIRASQLGLKTALVEEKHLGGICLNWGCIPTKALLRSAEIHHLIQHADQFGIEVKDVQLNIKKIVQRSRDVASKLSAGIGHLMKKHKVTVFEGRGTLNGKGQVKVSKDNKKIANIQATSIILATGARARQLPHIPTDGQQIVSYKDAMIPKKLPKSLLVIGSGAIGIEFASFYHHLGCKVTVVEVAERILPVEDTEISKLANKIFTNQGMELRTDSTVEKVEKSGNSVKVTVKPTKGKAEILTVDRVISAVGIVPNTENLGLEGTKVRLTKQGHVKTDDYSATDEKNIYAIGDITEGPWLAHKASHEAVLCVEHIAGHKVKPLNRANIPGCTYCLPQIASVGLTEEKATQEGYDIKVGRFPYMANGKAIALGEEQGLIKTIFDKKTGELLGCHMIGAEVTEMINGVLVGKTMEATEQDFIHTIFPHPTLSEMLHESVLDADSKALHI